MVTLALQIGHAEPVDLFAARAETPRDPALNDAELGALSHWCRHDQQNRWPHRVTTGSTACSRQILHSKAAMVVPQHAVATTSP
mmetsp:Transcript_44365/g.117695  ORF Transcript_44365/g.117695 Transcript_44365/m.117695 type:complete len:84 (-) Transcript_44365:16-267(-)